MKILHATIKTQGSQIYFFKKVGDTGNLALITCLQVKNLPANAGASGDMGWIPGSRRSPEGRHGYPLQYSCLENPHGQKNVVGYSPWGRKESDTTEQLSIYPHIARQKYRFRAADLTIFQEQRF